MEFIDGAGLDRVIVNEGKLPVERAAMLGAQVADALDFAHRNHVVHRDEAGQHHDRAGRPSEGIDEIAKVTDWATTSMMTGSPGSRHGGFHARPGRSLDGRSDLFAVLRSCTRC